MSLRNQCLIFSNEYGYSHFRILYSSRLRKKTTGMTPNQRVNKHKKNEERSSIDITDQRKMADARVKTERDEWK